jgi:1,4-dihydroxy-2-naphthoyl-CoA hydrolase
MSDLPPTPVSRRAENDRAAIALEVIFQANDQPPRLGTLEDLSAGGARIKASKPSQEGEVVLVHLPWPSRDEPTTVTAVVRWSEARRMGIQFSMAGPAESVAIANLRAAGPLAAKARAPEKGSRADGGRGFTRDELLSAPGGLQRMERRVRFQEVDAAGTIYYSRVFEYFGDVYIELLERGGVSVPDAMVKRDWFAPLVHAEAEYLAPMRFGDSVVVQIARVRCGTSAATVGYRITSAGGQPLAVGHTVHVFVDGATFRPCPIPADVLAALTATPI